MKLSDSVEKPFALGLAIVMTGVIKLTIGSSLINPMGLAFETWIGLYLLKQFIILLIWDNLVSWLVANVFNVEPMPSRPPKGKRSSPFTFEMIDIVYLVFNSFLEFTFIMNLAHFAISSGKIVHGWDQLTILNTLVAFFCLPMVNDMLYAPAHRFMHWKPVYPWVHKHHHRQYLPHRGYLDAANEHPVEQVVGLSLLWTAINIVAMGPGLHLSTLVVYFILYGVLALLNHTPYDFNINIPFLNQHGICFSVRAHEMHHRIPNCNYGQHVMVWDKLMGTFKEYVK